MRRYPLFWLSLAAALCSVAAFYRLLAPEVARTRRSELAFRAGLEHLRSLAHLPETREKLADKEFQTACRLAPNRDRMLRRITAACLAEHFYNQALYYAEKRLALDQSYEWVMYCGHLAYLAGDVEKCTKYYEQAIDMRPRDWTPYNALGYFYADLGIKLDRAEELLTTALALEEESRPPEPISFLLRSFGAETRVNRAMILDSLAWLHYRQKRLDQAWREISEAYRILPYDPTISYHYDEIKRACAPAHRSA